MPEITGKDPASIAVGVAAALVLTLQAERSAHPSERVAPSCSEPDAGVSTPAVATSFVVGDFGDESRCDMRDVHRRSA